MNALLRTLNSALTVLALLHMPLMQAADSTSDDSWVSLFNGRDLKGWTPKFTGHALGANPGETFRVEQGILRVVYDPAKPFQNEFGHLFYRAPFTHYVLRIEYRFVGEQASGGPGWAYRNSGVMVHSQAPETMGEAQNFPVSIEVQFLGGNGIDARPTGNLCTPGTHVVMDGKLHTAHCTESTSPTFHGEQWVTAEVEVRGNERIVHRINGTTVMEYSQPQLDPDDADAQRLIQSDDLSLQGGFIALQAESHPIEFRRVEIRMLKP